MIYLDHAAATPLSDKALQSMLPYFSDYFFNPSSPYLPARQVRDAYNTAKNQIAHAIGAKGDDLIITAGATESINLAFTVLDQHSKALISATEHAAVVETAKAYDYDIISVDLHGRIDLSDFKAKITDPAVRLVSVALVNNEIGTIQPISELAEIIRSERQRRSREGITAPLYFHSDASQALSLLDVSVSRLGVDMLTINSAKVYGPKGIGALYANHSVVLSPLTLGGGQERGLRSGTENVPLAIGFATAIADAKSHLSANRKKYTELNHLFHQELSHSSLQPLFLGNPKHQLANFVPITYPGIDAERIIYRLEDEEIYLSTGAACAASKGQKSLTLQAIGLSDDEIKGSLRISLGRSNTPDQIKKAAERIAAAALAESRF